MWNEPKQERSRKRFNHILDTAADLFVQHGYDPVTTNHIAEKAQVAIGSLYQFFPNKEAILGALVSRYVEDMQLIFPAEIDTSVPFETYISLMIDNLAAFEMSHTAFKCIFTTLDGLRDMETKYSVHGVVVSNVERMLAAYYPQMDDEQRTICAAVGIGIVKGLMILAEPPYALPPDAMLRETKSALTAYVKAFVEREL